MVVNVTIKKERRGTDTRYGFTGNLYKALTDKGIHTFIDENDLRRGDEITPALLKAIDESRIFIPVFSIKYASSSFCLDELVHIIHCYTTKGRVVLPVFFGVEPSHVRHHKGSYGQALAEHKKRFQNDEDNIKRLQRWKVALSQAANFSGYHDSPPGYEYELIGKIVKEISNKISRQPLHVANYPIGLQSRVQQVKSLLDERSDDGVHMVGLYGTGGLGKSTLAKAIYNFIADQFECSCFLENVRENSASNKLKHLQEELLLKTLQLEIKLGGVSEGISHIKERLHSMKILLILDDVDDMGQLQALAGEPDWFGLGSRVIITTRDRHLLTSHDIERKYALEGLCRTEALELLRWMAFKNNKVPSVYEDVLNRAVSYASGLPLVLEVVGSNLFGKRIEEWKGTLEGYEKIPNKKIHEILKVSYDALEEEQQSVFLDIACCFKGCGLEVVEDILRAHYGHCITHHLGVLAEKSLVQICTYHSGSIYKVTLHNLIEDMGKEVVRQESPKEPGERSRLWCQDDIVHVLTENTGTRNIEMIHLNCPSMENVIEWNGKAMKKMTNLKTLIIENGQFSRGPDYLPSSLRFCKWNGCPSKSLSSCILNKKFNYMKVLKLNSCQYLTQIPDVSGLPNLEKLSFQFCENLITIHNSVGFLNRLEILDAKYCIKLQSVPPLQLPCLKRLELAMCKSLKSFPELLCKMTNLKDIWLNETCMEFPFSIQNLSELDRLQIYQCGMLRFPKQNDKMNSIVFSNVNHLRIEKSNLSDEFLRILLMWCVNVENLVLSESNFKILPECLSECHLLKNIYVDGCKFLEEIRGFPPNLKIFHAKDCESLSSSSRRMLLSQQLHKAGHTDFYFPTGSEGIPNWFEYQIKVNEPISFSFHGKIPCITCIILNPESVEIPQVNLFLNGDECPLHWELNYENVLLPSKHTFLFDLGLKSRIYDNFNHMPEMIRTIKKNELNHVEIDWEKDDLHLSEDEIKKLRRLQMGIHVSWTEETDTEEEIDTEEDDFSDDEIFTESSSQMVIHYQEKSNTEQIDTEEDDFYRSAQMGIHVVKEKSNIKDHDLSEDEIFVPDEIKKLSSAQIGIHEKSNTEDVIFTNPNRTTTTTKPYYSQALFPNPPRKIRKFRPTLKKQRFVEVSKTESLQRRSLEETKSDGVKSLEVSETESLQQQYLAVVSGMRNLVLTETKEKHRFVEVGVSETETAHRWSLEETKSDGVKRFEVSETESLQQQDLALLSSGMQNMVLTDKKEKENNMTSMQEVYSELNGLDLEGHIQKICQVETTMVGRVYQT
ncbi:putative TIR domain, winged helix-turn-helix DNA-binding domain-containing protein [Medicago truncatula]|uniref:Putative TIR domain, winged helix-turn-helix DNA-binding domain-containing protein n=1 Tax=Medicago truncatula TaxID=3880 RepID=A0A396HNI1_MEDTR|nr:putative TIR domain, winged helix-turn-helix DNA-binding domain-containing protein [Medicago truncatula]